LGIALLRNYTLEPIIPFLKHWCFAADLQPEIAIGNYDTVRQEVLDPESLVYQPGVDLVVVSWLLEHLDPRSRCADWDESAAQREVLATLEELVRRSSSLIVVNTLIPPLFTENGFGAGLSADHRVSRVESVNMAIRRFAAANAGRVFVIDHSRLVRMLGEER